MSAMATVAGSKATGVPRPVLVGAAALVLFVLSAVAISVTADVGASRMPIVPIQEQLALRFEDGADGSVIVRDAANGQPVFVVAPGTNGFIRATVRGLTRERVRAGIGAEPPFFLTHWTDGTITLEDKSTGRKIGLDAFGPTNSEAFAQIFTTRSAPK